MPRVTLNRAEVQAAKDPEWAIASAVFRMLAEQPYAALEPRQQAAQLLLFYSNEVDNGGHLQYFHNHGVDQADALLAALAEAGATQQRTILEQALGHVREHPVGRAESLEEYSDWAHEQEFRAWDDAYYACRPELGQQLLPAYIVAHVDDFVEWVAE